MDKSLTINEAARSMGVSRQSVYIAIKSKKMKAKKVLTNMNLLKWTITKEDLDEYKRNKYSREKSVDENGDKLYDHSKGIYSVAQLGQKFDIAPLRIYYWIYRKYLNYTKKGATYLIDVDEFKKCYDFQNRFD